jgi:phage I-like protein
VRLSRAEAETARDLGMTEQEYARNKQLLKKEGRL